MATKTHKIQFSGFCIEGEREMTSAELAEYFHGIAKMFEESAALEEQSSNYNGMPECNIKLTMNCK